MEVGDYQKAALSMEGSLQPRCAIWHLPTLFWTMILTCASLDAHGVGHWGGKGKKSHSNISWNSI